VNELHLFAGAGGGILGGILLGHTCVCAVEIEPYCRKVLLQRQRDGILPKFPIWDDVRTFDGKPWRGLVDVVCGGFPCTEICVANNSPTGTTGIDGKFSGLWSEQFRLVCEIRPRFVFVENSPALVIRGLGRVLSDLASVGYDARWRMFRASEIGAPIVRERIFILAIPNGERWVSMEQNQQAGCSDFNRENFRPWRDLQDKLQIPMGLAYDPAIRGVLRNDDGLAVGVDRVRAIGNGQVPAVVKLAWETLIGGQRVKPREKMETDVKNVLRYIAGKHPSVPEETKSDSAVSVSSENPASSLLEQDEPEDHDGDCTDSSRGSDRPAQTLSELSEALRNPLPPSPPKAKCYSALEAFKSYKPLTVEMVRDILAKERAARDAILKEYSERTGESVDYCDECDMGVVEEEVEGAWGTRVETHPCGGCDGLGVVKL